MKYSPFLVRWWNIAERLHESHPRVPHMRTEVEVQTMSGAHVGRQICKSSSRKHDKQSIPKPPSQKTCLLCLIVLSRTERVFVILCTVHDTSLGRPNKLLLLKVDCSTRNETSENSETHQASRNPIRTKTNILNCKPSLYRHPPTHTQTHTHPLQF